MMIINRAGIVLLLLLLAACTTQPVVQEQATAQDLFEIEKLAAAAYEGSNWLEGEKHYLVLVEKDPEQSLYWLRLGNIYARTNRPDAAVMAYREALIRDPELTNAWYNMGIIQLKQAAYSFNEMQLYVNPDDPVTSQSQKLLEGILGLIQGENKE
jgi:cytochrome c-type biogenesis protein CcmH/NrfG